MSADRKLLEDAAKAAGINGEWSTTVGGWDCLIEPNGHAWQPIYDDGDALRLAVKLNIRVGCEGSRVGVDWWAPDGVTMLSDSAVCGTDPYAATRRAIVRAAVAIGAAK
jgi:hypothetical protein